MRSPSESERTGKLLGLAGHGQGAKGKNLVRDVIENSPSTTEACEYAQHIVDTVRDALLVLDDTLVIQSASRSFYEMFRLSPHETEKRHIYSLGEGQWNTPGLRKLLEELLPNHRQSHDYEVAAVFPGIGHKVMCLNGRCFALPSSQRELILIAITDITEKARLKRELAEKARLLDLSNDAIMVRDSDENITLWNRGAEKMYGWKAGEVMGKHLHSLMRTKFPKPLEEILVQLRREGQFRGEVVQTAKDGRRVASLCRWVFDPQTGSILTSYTDITERKLIEEEQAAELADAKQLQRISGQLIQQDKFELLYDELVATTMAVMRSHAASLQMFSPKRGELRLLAWRGFHPDTAKSWEFVRPGGGSSCGAALRVGERVVVPDVEKSEAISTEDLAAYHQSGLRAAQSTPLISRSGTIVGMLSSYWREMHEPQERELRVLDVLARQAADVIERRQQQDALRRSEASQRLIFETVEDFAIFSMDKTGRVTVWNPGARRIFAYEVDEIVGEHASILFTPEDQAAGVPEQEMQAARRDGYALDERWHLRKGNERFFASGSMRPLLGDTGKFLGFVKVARDITERKRNEEALLRAQAQLGNYASELERTVAERTARLQETVQELESYSYSIAHDMRAPLRAMSSFARLIQTEHSKQLDESAKNYLERIVTAAQRLDHLVTDVLNYSRVSRREIQLGRVNLGALVEETIRNQPELQPPLAQIRIQRPLHDVIAHDPMLMQVINNLLSNAVKFVLPGVIPRVTIRSELKGEDVRVWFEDNGIGIAEKDIKRIFSLFGRLHPAAEFEGTGIGLTIVRKAVERMGGTVGVESEAGKGSRFWIQLKTPNAHEARDPVG